MSEHIPAPGPLRTASGRARRSRRRVAAVERVAAVAIQTGGIGTIVAVGAVFLFLVFVVQDLFRPARVGAPVVVPGAAAADDPLDVGADDHLAIVWTLSAGGVVRAAGLDDGSLLEEVRLVAPGGPRITAYARDADGVVLGFADGTVRLGRIGFETEFREAFDVDPALRDLAVGGTARQGRDVAMRTVSGLFRIQRLVVELDDPVTFRADPAPIVAIHRAAKGDDVLVAVVDAAGRVGLRRRSRFEDLRTLEVETEWSRVSEVPVGRVGGRPDHVLITDLASNLVLGWRSGTVERWAIRSLREPALAEIVDLAPGGAEIRSLGVLLGGSTLVCGRSDGVVTGSFVVPDPANRVDGTRLAVAHQFRGDGRGAVVALATSVRTRIFAVGTADGRVGAAYMTSELELADLDGPDGPVAAVGIAPKDDALLAATRDGVRVWSFDPAHPEATLGTLFGAVWYERFPEPDHVWQSSSGSDAFEPKLSLVPLVFGTVKATFYALLLAVPLALLAAIYTSQFLAARARARIKPVVELMASLPSVVLGFLAALVIAPVAESVMPALLAGAVTVPFAVLLGASLWLLLPPYAAARLEFLRLPLTGLSIAVGVAIAFAVGPSLEDLLFAGDLRAWLNVRAGSGYGGFVVLMAPLSALAVGAFVALRVNPWLGAMTARLGVRTGGAVHVLKLALGLVAFVAGAAALAAVVHGLPLAFGGAPWDLREGLRVGAFDLSPIGTFDQRNALVVGFVMGFAIVPIVFTIAEDALSSVPAELRAGALGAGATPWQAAIRVVVPAAASGLLSACMVGLGRAVGETMIVLMAAGGTAVTSMNMFNGFRTLTANIATELPEAVRDSTHYRTLFLAALLLFALTFVINTVADRVRARFRGRLRQL